MNKFISDEARERLIRENNDAAGMLDPLPRSTRMITTNRIGYSALHMEALQSIGAFSVLAMLGAIQNEMEMV